ncbi:MAG TPA: cyclic nucleotide-binding domain-containing protein, partial [Acidimicrobiales bacterium]|nr:cyclic nucleotide-binding domain-containing protein [Acidimicrobiales bacterium]
RAYIEVSNGRIVGSGYAGRGQIGSTTVKLGGRAIVFQAVPLPDLQPAPQVSETEVTFVQTAGGRTGLPAPRTVRRAPFVQFAAPLAWTTLALTIRADGSSRRQLVGASPFPRHWVYDDSGALCAKSGLVDFNTWWRRAFGRHTPWGDTDSAALTAEVETALERQLSAKMMRGGPKPEIRTFAAGTVITEQGQPGKDVYLVLDGIVRIEVDGQRIAEYGPGSMHGERAILEQGVRTSTIRAVTACRLAVARASQFDKSALTELSRGHRREST